MTAATPESPDPSASPESSAAAADFLSRVQGSGELIAALLALLLPPGSKRARRAWEIETEATTGAAAVLAQVTALLPNARLPWFERLLKRMRRHPLEQRQVLLESTRRLMSARGSLRAIDRLHWFAMRQRLGEATPASARQAASADLSQLPGGDALVHALHQLQAMAWMQRPVLVRNWLDAALARRERGRLRDSAADALRLSCALLDSPLPPELARHYIEPPEELR